ncbi:uncharacterized protein LOC143034960 [Oratosquilla oratoria]|uniref:uncharacterized protein LOC143034960 n=1 Tax=Oratosquilla oratoria TaxID=337810 RepID=UPI003F774F63
MTTIATHTAAAAAASETWRLQIGHLIVPIWKGKGDRQDWNNYCGITLFSVPSKSTTVRVLALRTLAERRRDSQQGFLQLAYVGLKEFGSVHRGVLCNLMRIQKIPARIIDLINLAYSGTESAV